MTDNYKIELRCEGTTIQFEVLTTITEGRNATYENYTILHLPTDIFTYRNTTSRHFSIPIRLVSRNGKEADENANKIDLIRSWVLPDFGNSGATPPFVFFFGL